MNYKGSINARIVDVRFASGGKVAQVVKHAGDAVSRGSLIAALDRKVLQAELERELANYEKIRADFEIFAQKNPNPESVIDKYLKTEKQVALNASVKEVEIAKTNLDLCDLFSPVDGIIIDDSGMVVGQNITPASASVKIIDTSSFCFEFNVEQEEVKNFMESKSCKIRLNGVESELIGQSMPVYYDGKKFTVRVNLAPTNGVLPGMVGEVEV